MQADTLRDLPPRTTAWFEIDAARVQAFADATEDWQPIHLDPAFAAGTPFGVPIAHGFLTLSMLSAMSYQVTEGLDGVASSVNYGFDRIRFVSPVPVGRRVRGVFAVANVDAAKGHVDVYWDVQVEIEDEARPALVARWITRFYLT